MKLNKPKTSFVSSAKEFYDILLDKQVENLTILPFSAEICQMTWNRKNDFVENVFTNNIGVAAYTTSWARLMFLDVLERVGDRVLGYDTDSCWYIEKEGENLLGDSMGDSLGELTDKLGGEWITKWTATGPKSYAYETSSGKKTTKVKGFTLNHKNVKKINLDSMRDVILEDKRITIDDFQIVRTQEKEVWNKSTEKNSSLDMTNEQCNGFQKESIHIPGDINCIQRIKLRNILSSREDSISVIFP